MNKNIARNEQLSKNSFPGFVNLGVNDLLSLRLSFLAYKMEIPCPLSPKIIVGIK